jgi:hypothetical protein
MKSDPSHSITTYEFNHLFYSFCTLISLLQTKKMNLANIFLLLLQNPSVRTLFKEYCGFENDYSAIKSFLQFDTGLYKSKYIMKYLNANKNALS